MALRDPGEDCTRQELFARDLFARRDGSERPRGRDPQASHGLAHDVLAQHGAEPGTPIALPRKRGGARTLELDVAAHAIAIDQLSEENRPAIAQLGNPAPKLKTRVSHGERLGAVWHPISGQNLNAFRSLQSLGAEPEMEGQALVQLDQARFGYRGRGQAREEPVGKPRVGIVEEKEGVACHWIPSGLRPR